MKAKVSYVLVIALIAIGVFVVPALFNVYKASLPGFHDAPMLEVSWKISGPDPAPGPVCAPGQITCCYGDGNCECSTPQQCDGTQDDDPLLCMTSVQPLPGENALRTYERRSACILNAGGVPSSSWPYTANLKFAQSLSPSGSTLATSLESAVGLTRIIHEA